MKFGRYGWSYLLLRVGLGLTFLWIGVDMIRTPNNWIGFMPDNAPFGFSPEQTLQLASVFDIALGALLLANYLPRLTAALTTLHLAGILVTQGLDAVLIRDVGLLGAAAALLTWPQHRRRKSWLPFGKGKKDSGGGDDE